MAKGTHIALLILLATGATTTASSGCREWPTEPKVQIEEPKFNQPDTTKACKECSGSDA